MPPWHLCARDLSTQLSHPIIDPGKVQGDLKKIFSSMCQFLSYPGAEILGRQGVKWLRSLASILSRAIPSDEREIVIARGEFLTARNITGSPPGTRSSRLLLASQQAQEC